MSDQEFRDRCAKAMGLTLTEPQRFGRYWEGPGVWVYAEDWKPDVNYNHAMMMRDACEDGWASEFYFVLATGKFSDEQAGVVPNWGHIEDVAHAAARQIAEAALKVLESKEASSARTQEDA